VIIEQDATIEAVQQHPATNIYGVCHNTKISRVPKKTEQIKNTFFSLPAKSPDSQGRQQSSILVPVPSQPPCTKILPPDVVKP
jgi:hypothetical protein